MVHDTVVFSIHIYRRFCAVCIERRMLMLVHIILMYQIHFTFYIFNCSAEVVISAHFHLAKIGGGFPAAIASCEKALLCTTM